MKKVLIALALFFIMGANGSPLAPSLTLDQTNPVYGQSISLTGIYGKVYGGRHPQFPNQPAVQINCTSIDGTMQYQDNQWTSNKISLGQGWNQSSYPFTLGTVGNSNNWTSGPANCGAILYYFDGNSQLQELASVNFYVGP